MNMFMYIHMNTCMYIYMCIHTMDQLRLKTVTQLGYL